MESEKQMYMNLSTGSVDQYDGWFYENQSGQMVNAVDLKEVVPVVWNKNKETWMEEEIAFIETSI